MFDLGDEDFGCGAEDLSVRRGPRPRPRPVGWPVMRPYPLLKPKLRPGRRALGVLRPRLPILKARG